MACFQTPLQPDELAGVRTMVTSKLASGVDTNGNLTLTGFLFLHAMFIERGRMETTWAVLRQFGYGNDLSLRADLLPNLVTHADQVRGNF